MRNLKVFLKTITSLLFFLIVSTSCTRKEESSIVPLFPNTLKVQIDETISETLGITNVPGVIAGVWIDGIGYYCTSAGISNIITHEAMETDFNFRIGSITKTFTAILVLQIADEGLIELDEPIQTYLPEKNIPRGDEITIRMLGDMTSGLFSYTFDSIFGSIFLENPNKVWLPDSLLARAFSHPNLFDPGTEFFYCNTNTVILGLLIEKLTGKPVSEVIEDRILVPLAMNNTLWPHGSFLPSPYPHGYTCQTIDGKMADATYWNPSWAYTAGQLISNIFDLKKHIESVARGGLISAEMFDEQQQWIDLPPKGKYGFGLTYKNGWVGHNGSLPGFNTAMYRHEEAGVTIVINVNSDIHESTEMEPASMFFQRIVQVVAPEYPPHE